ncbi:MAG: Ig-like domain-containing protein, partial [Chloroflexales bacterium]|nr:Ig-like domain-containing protein [Chloroflexales bacterium]
MRFLRPLARFWTVLLGSTVLALTLAVAARYLIPLTPSSPAPILVAAIPPDGAADVRPRAAISLRFSAPMNRASAEAALRIDPPTPGSLSWSPDATTLTFQPAEALVPAVTYTISLAPSAQGRWWQPIDGPSTFRFRTAPQPAVVMALPATTGAPADTALAVVFSQPMVAPTAVGMPVDLPELRLEPPAPFHARWADQSTLLIMPDLPLAVATGYRATIGAGLTDLRGVELGTPFSWSFTTGWPAIVGRAPEQGARWVSPRAPLSIRLSAPMDPALLGQALRISPRVEGDLAAEMIGATQVVTFTPRGGWAYGTTYSVALTEPPGSGLGAPPAMPWQFSVEPAPRLVAFFPGQGQALPPGEAIRLVFSTPMDEAALRAGLSIDPPVGDLQVSARETEVRLRPQLRPSTTYTITLAADTRDRNGEPLGAEATVRLLTAPARPALAAPAAREHIITLPVSRTAQIELATTNLSALDLSLYPLDQATLLRALALRADEWPAFSPERYGQTVARGWRVTLSAPSDQADSLALPVGLSDGAPLPPGAYYLRAIAPEGPRADLLLLASEARLALRRGPG